MWRGDPGPSPRSGAPPPAAAREDVNVVLRIRPLSASEEADHAVAGLDTALRAASETSAEFVLGATTTTFSFSHVLDEHTTQEATFRTAALPLIEDVLAGRNALLFTYGVTNSGKSHTMQGPPGDRGLVPRCLESLLAGLEGARAPRFSMYSDSMNQIFLQTDEQREADLKRFGRGAMSPGRAAADAIRPAVPDAGRHLFTVFLSYVEVYGDRVYDLLEAPGQDARPAREPRKLREANGRTFVSDVTEVEVHDLAEARELVARGNGSRQTASTAVNATSSRSHSVLTLRVARIPRGRAGRALRDPGLLHISQLSLVDLAGTERADRTQTRGQRQREAGDINVSLLALRQCFEALRRSKRTGRAQVVPYRDSSLTRLFRNYFEGDGRVTMLVCASPAAADAEETRHVLQCGVMASTLTTPASSTGPALGSALRRRPLDDDDGVAHRAKRVAICLDAEPAAAVAALMHSEEDVLATGQSMRQALDAYAQAHHAQYTTRLQDLQARGASLRDAIEAMEVDNVQLRARAALLAEEKQTAQEAAVALQREFNALVRKHDDVLAQLSGQQMQCVRVAEEKVQLERTLASERLAWQRERESLTIETIRQAAEADSLREAIELRDMQHAQENQVLAASSNRLRSRAQVERTRSAKMANKLAVLRDILEASDAQPAQQGSLVDSLPDPPGYLARAAEVRAPARAAQAAANVGSDYRTTEEIRAQLSAARPAGPAGTAAMTPMLTPIRRRDATSRRL
eukprot:m.147546 g.147546  ORF g.147546 m.147546 type:complete len:747 (-) comp9709_c1_seq1:245-2485(-)